MARGRISRERFAAQVGKSTVTLRRWEKNENSPGEGDLLLIARETGVSVDWLKNGQGEMFPGDPKGRSAVKRMILKVIHSHAGQPKSLSEITNIVGDIFAKSIEDARVDEAVEDLMDMGLITASGVPYQGEHGLLLTGRGLSAVTSGSLDLASSQSASPTANQSEARRTDDTDKDRHAGLAYLPLSSVQATAGSGEEPFHAEIESYIAYDRAQLRRDTGVSPEQLVVMPVAGSSMQPTLLPGERVLVARYNGEPVIDGAVYVFNRRYRGVMIKRAFWQEGGALLLRGDNPNEPHPMTIQPGDEEDWIIIGRVVRVEKNL